MKPILFNDAMVRAILDGRKTQTRRVVDSIAGMGRVAEFQASHTPGYAWTFRDRRSLWNDLTGSQLLSRCPLGQPGDRLWVREAWGIPQHGMPSHARDVRDVVYRADGDKEFREYGYRWRPSIHMPRWASRITLAITDVRVQRLQDISEDDAQAEGCEAHSGCNGCGACMGTDCDESAVDGFRDLWDSIAKPGTLWRDNPWVWAISFQRVGV